jgi:hypothetical protein
MIKSGSTAAVRDENADGRTGVHSAASGALPAGLTLTSAGVLSATPTTPGIATFSIRATDPNGFFAQLSFTTSITSAVPTLPQAFVLLLALRLAAVGYYQLHARARPE